MEAQNPADSVHRRPLGESSQGLALKDLKKGEQSNESRHNFYLEQKRGVSTRAHTHAHTTPNKNYIASNSLMHHNESFGTLDILTCDKETGLPLHTDVTGTIALHCLQHMR